MLKCAIIDDEQDALNLLKLFIEEVPELMLTYATTNAVEILLYLQNETIDILFLDVNMPKISGIELLKLISKLPVVPFFIFTTGNPLYALEGFDYDVIDFLLKPIHFDRFYKSVQKAMLLRNNKEVFERKGYFFVGVETKNKMIKINYEDILYIEGLKQFVSIYTQPERIVTLLKMKDLERTLPTDKFLRVHKSFIIPTERIKSLVGNSIHLIGEKTTIPLGGTYKDTFVKFLKKNSVSS